VVLSLVSVGDSSGYSLDSRVNQSIMVVPLHSFRWVSRKRFAIESRSVSALKRKAPTMWTRIREAQTGRAGTDGKNFGQNGLESKRQFSRVQALFRRLFANRHSALEHEAINRNCTPMREDMSLWHSALLAALVTTAIALFSAAMVFSPSGTDIAQGLLSQLPPTIEPFSWKNQNTAVDVLQQDKTGRPRVEEVANQDEKEERTIPIGERAAGYQKEQIPPPGEELIAKLDQEKTGAEARDLAYEERFVPTLVVTVQKGDTIYRILRQRFGQSSKGLLEAVRELNPEIEDLDLIRVGQVIRLPSSSNDREEVRLHDTGGDRDYR
jgi:hypothetical protein